MSSVAVSKLARVRSGAWSCSCLQPAVKAKVSAVGHGAFITIIITIVFGIEVVAIRLANLIVTLLITIIIIRCTGADEAVQQWTVGK